MAKTPASKVREVGLREGFRSGLEEQVAQQLRELGIDPSFEDRSDIIEYLKPARKSKYLRDFRLPNGIIIETKGRFVTADRQKHILIKQQHPHLDIRFVFSNPNARISKQSKTTYADWCLKYGFKFAKKRIPQEWIDE